IASCYPGLNLLPMDSTLDFVLVRILRFREHPREIRLRALFSQIGDLPKTSSHLEWGHCVGIERGRLVIERHDGSPWLSDPL
ncbi:MAG: hypothetical protein ABW193_06110, partial [Luteibacter sp.]